MRPSLEFGKEFFGTKEVKLVEVGVHNGTHARDVLRVWEEITELHLVDAYIDFGAQPGKDRLPREATACGCPSFIMNTGAGLNNSDFPRAKYFRFKAYQLFMLEKIINRGLDYLEDNLIAERSRYAEVHIEEAEFSLRVKQIIDIVGS